MQIGAEYWVHSYSVQCSTEKVRPKIQGRVIYVHPQGRFATLEFQGVHGTFRECFYPEELTERNRVGKKKARRIRIVC